MRRYIRKICAIVLTLSLVITAWPTVTRATALGVQKNAAPDVSSAVQQARILGEIEDLREESVKHFYMSDGSITAIQYAQPIHYKDSLGEYAEIDNTVTLTEDQNGYTNKANELKMYFPKAQTDAFRLEHNGNSLSWKLKSEDTFELKADEKLTAETNEMQEISVKEFSVQIENNEQEVQAFATGTSNITANKVKTYSKVNYAEILEGVDITYELLGKKVKESIVLKTKPNKYTYEYEFITDGMIAVRQEDNSVIFYDKNDEAVFYIAAPFMFDSSDAISTDITVGLSESKEGYIYSITADKEWLDSADRAYPVTIDPTIIPAYSAVNIKDNTAAFANYNSGANGYLTNGYLRVGKHTSIGNFELAAIVYGAVPNTIPSTASILTAKLGLGVCSVAGGQSTSGVVLNAHKITSDWNTGNINQDIALFNNTNPVRPNADDTVIDYFIAKTEHANTYQYFDITKAAQDWINGGNNYGIMIRMDASQWQSGNFVRFYSSDIGTFAEPMFIFNYRDTTGLEDYWSYTSSDFGQFGAAYINNYNGNLVYTHNSASYVSEINGFVLSHIYNSSSSSQGIGKYGAGWRLSLEHRLVPVSIEGNTSVKYKYIDGDGTEHYFVEGSDGKITDEDGLGYTFTAINETTDNGTTPLKYKIEDKQGNVYKFDTWNYLRRIIDTNGNTINLNYSPMATADNYLSSITTSSGGLIALDYDSSYKLTGIRDNAGRTTSFAMSDGNLTSITYPDGKVINFTYDANKLTQISLPNYQVCEYTYLDNARVGQVSFFGRYSTEGAFYTFEYDYNQTVIKDALLRSVTYQFDTLGRPVCVYDHNENIYSNTYTVSVSGGNTAFSNNKVSSESNGSVYVNNMLANPVFSNGTQGYTVSNSSGGAVSVAENTGLLSSQSIKVSNSSVISTYIQQPTSGGESTKTYTFSGYFKTENVVSSGYGAVLEVETTLGNTHYSDYLTGSTDNSTDNGFVRLTVTFTLAETEKISCVKAGLSNATGVLYIDSLQLEEGDAANQINLIDNSSFQRNAGGGTVPEGFSGITVDGVNGVTNVESHHRTVSVKLVGNALKTRSIYQEINTSGKAGDIYSVGTWVKADSVPNHETAGAGSTDFKVCVKTYNGTSEAESVVMGFNEYVSDWQYASKTFILKKDYTKIIVFCSYDHNSNTAYFDSLFLYRDIMQSYRYDDNGNVVSVSDYAQQNSQYNYTGNDLTKIVGTDGSGYEYLYDSNKNLLAARSSEGLQSNMQYDSNGNVTSTSVGANPYSSSLEAGKCYYISLKGSGKYLTVSGTNVVQADYTGDSNQQWKLLSAQGGYYLQSVSVPSKVMYTSNTATSYGSSIEIAEKTDDNTKIFKITPQNDYTYRLVPKSVEDMVVTVALSSQQNNVTVLGKSGENNADQEWYFYDTSIPAQTQIVSGEVYSFRAYHSGKYINVQNASAEVGTRLLQYEKTYRSNQRYKVTRHGDYFTLSPLHSLDSLLEVSTELGTDGFVYLQLGDSTVTDRKLFKFEYDSAKKGFRIIPKCDENAALDVAHFRVSNNAELIFTGKGTGVNRYFIAEKYSDVMTSSTTYQNNGNFISSVTDGRGYTTQYTYDTSRGVQTAVTDAKGNVTSYDYNLNNDYLNSVTSGNSTVTYHYLATGNLCNIRAPSGTNYEFTCDYLNRSKQIKISNRILSDNTYRDNYSVLVSRVDYGNNTYRTYEYDDNDRVVSEGINGVTARTYTYDKLGNIYKTSDMLSNVTTRYSYDLTGRLIGTKSSDSQTLSIAYDNLNRVSKYNWRMGNLSLLTEYIYGDSSVAAQKTGLIYGIKQNGTAILNYEYDELARKNKRTLNTTTPYVTRYAYLEGADNTTTTALVKALRNGNDTYLYEYDELGNITQIALNNSIVEKYTYDSLNQLIKVERGSDVYEYTYDNGGNILSVTQNGTAIKSYTYGDSSWKDLLTAYNGTAISYDTIGNPLNWKNGETLTWSNGRWLGSVGEGISYTYNADGLRTSKTVNGTTTEYYWNNGVLQGQKTGNEYIIYLYDEDGSAYGLLLKNGTTEQYYYYLFNVQGDVIGIVDSTGTKVVEYTYSAWGELLSTTGTMAQTIGETNPIRYRGYYYDTETGFYYLQSRYYDPQVGRFINADSFVSTGQDLTGFNMFAYCGNNPVNMHDDTGTIPKWLKKVAKAAAVVVTVAVVAAVVVSTCGAGSAAAAVAVGAAKGAAVGMVSGAVSGAAVGYAATGTLDGALNGMGDGALSGAVSGAISGAISSGYARHTMSKAQTSISNPTSKGTQNPKVKAAVEKGIEMHKQMDYGPGVLKEQKIAPGCRVDGIDINNHIIYELKPNNPQSIARGMKQLDRYMAAAKQKFGGDWAGVLKLYD